ncbi:MAG TPA: hypothetical protein GYA08_24555 [Chloroflexi bacterium]|nr:hypothetical protein [Chloroflexota bacterium]
MHRRYGVFSVLWLLMTLLAACQLDLPPITQGRTTPLDAPFTLRANQAIELAGEGATLRLEPWAEDKRCPADAECAEAGPVRVQVTLWREGRPTTHPVFVAHTDQTGAVLPDAPGSDLTAKVGPYRITLTAVTPYPTTATPTAMGEYAATFVVSKDPTANPDTDADMHVLTDQPFTLAPGEQVILTGANITLTVEAVTDARCVADAACEEPEGGVVQVALGWRKEGAAPQTITLTAHTDDAGAALPPAGVVRPFRLFDGVGFHLLSITPLPQVGVDLAPEDYRVTLMLEAGPRMSSGVDYAEPGQPFELGVGYTAIIGQDVLRVRFDEVVTDSRCPRLVVCVQAGEVQLALTVASTGQRPTSYVLGGATDSQGRLFAPATIAHDGFMVQLLQVTPYPAQPGAAIAADAYLAVFVVEAPPGLPTPIPTATLPAVTPEAAQLPLLCINDFALVRMAAGASDEPAIEFTEPLAQDAATDYGQAHALCNKTFGAEWVQAGPGDVPRFAQFLPAGQPFWVWDGMARSLIRYE